MCVQPGLSPKGAAGLFSHFTNWCGSSRAAGLAFVHCATVKRLTSLTKERGVLMFGGHW